VSPHLLRRSRIGLSIGVRAFIRRLHEPGRPQLRTSREGGADDVVEGTMSALHSRDSFAARACVWRARSLARVGRQFASTKAVVRCGFDPCGACTVDFDDGISFSPATFQGCDQGGARIAFVLPAEASHPRIPPVLRPRRRGGHPLRRTVGCRRFRTTGGTTTIAAKSLMKCRTPRLRELAVLTISRRGALAVLALRCCRARLAARSPETRAPSVSVSTRCFSIRTSNCCP